MATKAKLKIELLALLEQVKDSSPQIYKWFKKHINKCTKKDLESFVKVYQAQVEVD